MDMLSLCLSCLIFVSLVNKTECVLWQLVPGYANRKSLDFFLEIEVGSRMHCSAYCYQSAECIAFIFAPHETLNCQLLSKVAMAANSYEDSQDAVFYTRDMDCSMTEYGSGYRTAISEDGYAFAYKMCLTLYKTTSTGVAYCKTVGGNLLRLTTLPKLIKMSSIIKTCEYLLASWNYKVDGSNAAASDRNDLNGWTMANGDVLPSAVWATGYPKNPRNKNCVAIWSAFSWYIAEDRCNHAMHFFCEN